MNSLNICSWNANGLHNRIGELIEFLNRKKIDIMLINETKYVSTDKLKIKNYKCYRKERETAAGGVAILIKETIPHKEIVINNISSLEAVIIKLISNVYIISAYRRPSIALNVTDLKKLMDIGQKVLLLGDLNATHTTWNCSRNNKSGQILYKYVQSNDCVLIYTTEPTNYPPNNTNPSTIDIAINKNVNNISDLEAHHELSSDHIPVVLSLAAQTKFNVNRKIYEYEEADWTKFKDLLNKRICVTSKISTREDIDKEVQKLTNNINYCIQQTIPIKKCTETRDKLPKEIENIIHQRNRERKKWQKTKTPEQKRIFYNYNRLISKKIKEYRNTKWEEKLEKLNPNDNSLWKMTKIFKKEYNHIPILEKNNKEAVTPREKAEMLATQYENVHDIDLKNNTPFQQQVIEKVKKHMEETTITDAYKHFTNPKEIKIEINRLPSKKAPGIDNIQNIVLKRLTRKAIVQLMYIINASINMQYFTSHWKTGLITPILKPGKKSNDPASYRPISLLNTLSKLTEKIILNRLNAHDSKEKIIIDEQFGFRHNHNTVQQVVRIVNDISVNFNKKKLTTMVLLDIEKAFDKVWIDGLLYKMIQYKYPDVLIKLIHSYLHNRHLIVTVNGEKSTKRKIRAGVPQGSVLGSKFFIIFINDIPKFEKTNTALFADDLAIYAHSFSAIVAAKQLQMHIYQLEKYYSTWKIIVNKAKTEVIVFAKKTKDTKIFQPITVYGFPTTPVTTVRYLGVHLDSKITHHKHVKEINRKVYMVIKKIYPLLAKNSALSLKNKKLIYKMIIRPIITYASPVWCSMAKTHMKELQVLQNKCLRMVLSADRYTKIENLHQEAEIEYMDDYVKTLAENFYHNQLHSNPLLNSVTKIRNYNIPFEYKHKLPYHSLRIFKE